VWFQQASIISDDDKSNYIIAAANDDIVKMLREKKVQLNRPLTVDEYEDVIMTKYWRWKSKSCQIEKVEPNESVDYININLDLYDQLEYEDKDAILVINYENMLRPRNHIDERVAMAEVDTLMKACNLTYRYERILQDSYPSVLRHRNRTNRFIVSEYSNIEVNANMNNGLHWYNHISTDKPSLNYNSSYNHNSSKITFNRDRTNPINRNSTKINNSYTHNSGKIIWITIKRWMTLLTKCNKYR